LQTVRHPVEKEVDMKKHIAVALAAGALALPAAALAQQVLVPVNPPAAVIYPAPAAQTGVSYYCANPQGWHPTVTACSAPWAAYAQQPVVQVVPGATPSPHAGVSYWCAAPEGWYPTVQRCSLAWTPYTQPPPLIVGAAPPVDTASTVYYVGPHRNAPYQSGIFP
jgi:hypothetical protein